MSPTNPKRGAGGPQKQNEPSLQGDVRRQYPKHGVKETVPERECDFYKKTESASNRMVKETVLEGDYNSDFIMFYV